MSRVTRAEGEYVMQYLCACQKNLYCSALQTATMALSNKAMQTFSYMMLISLAAGTCGGLGFLLYAQNTGQFSALHPRTPCPSE